MSELVPSTAYKKRGGKTKNQIIVDVAQQTIQKKRGRKPKNQNNDDDQKNNKIKMDFDNKKIVVKLSKELDLNYDLPNYNTNEIQNDVINIWTNKYRPTKLSEVIGNENQINIIKKWLMNFETSQYHAAIISGGHGIGKNLIVKLALEDAGYLIRNIYSTSLKTKNVVYEIIHSCVKVKNVASSINQSDNKKCAIVIDDTESITLSSEKENLLELYKQNSLNKYFPLIFISNLQHSKLINNLKKISLPITLSAPTINQIKGYMINICNKEGMTITDDKIYNSIIHFCQSDIRRLVFVLQDMFYTFNKQPITYGMFKEYQQMSQKKDIDIGLYVAARNLLDNYKSINECLQLYETEKVLLPLTIYENYYRKIFKQNLQPNDILNIMSDVTNSVSTGDVIETNIYSDQNWFLQNIHGFYTCADTSYKINSIKSNEKLYYDVIFSADLNKTSSKNINKKKNIFPLQNKLKNKNIEDILYVNKIFFELDKLKMNNVIKQIKSTYDLDNKNIQIALKIDKTNDKFTDKKKLLFGDSDEINDKN